MIERMNPNHPDNNNCEGDLERDAEGELINILNHPRYKIRLWNYMLLYWIRIHIEFLDERQKSDRNNVEENNGHPIHSRERSSSGNQGTPPAITTFTQKTPSFAIQQLLGLTSSSTGSNNTPNVSNNSHGEGNGRGHGIEGHHGHHERYDSINSHHHPQHDLKNFSAEKFYNEAAAARSFLNAASSFSDQYSAAQRASYFNASAAAAGFFGNLQSQTAAAAAANAAAASFPTSMSPNSNMSHLLQVESSLRNEHPMHGRVLSPEYYLYE